MLRRNILIALSLAVAFIFVIAPARAASKKKIDLGIEETIEAFYKKVVGGEKLMHEAKGALIFPSVKKAGIGIGGEYGQGALLVNGETIDYYSTAAASIGFQLGFEARKEVILFMSDEALQKFRLSSGWEAGVDGSIAVISLGAGGEVDTTGLNAPVLGFIFSNKGLMINLSLEGSKFTRIEK